MNITKEVIKYLNSKDESVLFPIGRCFILKKHVDKSFDSFYYSLINNVSKNKIDFFQMILFESIKERYFIKESYKNISKILVNDKRLRNYYELAEISEEEYTLSDFIDRGLELMIHSNKIIKIYDNIDYLESINVRSNVVHFQNKQNNTYRHEKYKDLLPKDLTFFGNEIPFSKQNSEFINIKIKDSLVLSIIHYNDNRGFLNIKTLHDILFPIVLKLSNNEQTTNNESNMNYEQVMIAHLKTKQYIESSLWELMRLNLISIYNSKEE